MNWSDLLYKYITDGTRIGKIIVITKEREPIITVRWNDGSRETLPLSKLIKTD